MPTQINQIDLYDRRRTVLRVEGEMLREDAELIERLVGCISDDLGHTIVLDLADLGFIDSEAAPILKGLEDRGDVEIEGIEIFVQSAVDMAERV
jgi:anti-anti-sigma regulatory factor